MSSAGHQTGAIATSPRVSFRSPSHWAVDAAAFAPPAIRHPLRRQSIDCAERAISWRRRMRSCIVAWRLHQICPSRHIMTQGADTQELQSKAEAQLAPLKAEGLVTRIAVLSTRLGQERKIEQLMIGMSARRTKPLRTLIKRSVTWPRAGSCRRWVISIATCLSRWIVRTTLGSLRAHAELLRTGALSFRYHDALSCPRCRAGLVVVVSSRQRLGAKVLVGRNHQETGSHP